MAITYLAGNNIAGTASDRSGLTTTYLLTGTTFLETDTDDLYQWDGDSWNVISSNTVAETLSGKTFTTPQINDSATDHQYVFAVGNLAADRTVTLPVLTGNDTFVFEAHTQTFTNKTMSGAGNTFSNIPTSALTGTAFAVTDGSTASNIASGGTLTFAATANETTVAQSGGTVTIGLPNDVTIGGILTVTGNLTVNGTTTTVNSTTMTVDDPIITLGGDVAPGSDDNKDRGVEFRYHDGSARVGFFGYDDSVGVFTGFTAATNTSEVFSGTVMNATFGNIVGTLTTAAQGNITSLGTLSSIVVSGSGTVGGSDIVTLAATQTLAAKTLTAPKFVNTGFIADANGNEQIIFATTSSAVNEITITNGATGNSASITASGETNTGIKLIGKGTSGITLTNATANGAFLEFDTKAAPADPSTEFARMYLKEVDANNNAIAVKIQKGGSVVEVEITSPKAVCAECGSRDGAKDPLYDFERGVMVLDLWCGHSFEVPMQWSQINGNS